MGAGHGGKETDEGVEYHWEHDLLVWDPPIPLEYSLECMCKNHTEETNITDPCYEKGDFSEYNLGLHVMAIFVIFVASAIGVGFPVLSGSGLFRQPVFLRKILYFAKFFGSGVILSIAYVHLFPEAVELLTQECLPGWFNTDYSVNPGLFAMLGVLGTHLFEMLADMFLERNAKHVRDEEETCDQNDAEHGHADDEHCEHTHSLLIVSKKKHWITALILEIGINIHSIIVGISLGLAVDGFVPFLIALVFHQFFEGLSLGEVLSEQVQLATKEEKLGMRFFAFGSAFFYSFVTSTGIAIGVGIATSSQATTTSQILALGILLAISCGILTYGSLVTLIGVDFQTRHFKSLPYWQKAIAFISFYAGAALMSILALWA